jgi:hypothetical protein
MMGKKALEDKIFELVSYMVVSARNLIDETPQYGPFRLVDAVSRLVEILENMELSSSRLDTLRAQIEEGKVSVMAGEEEFREFLESLVSFLVKEIDQA